MPLIVFKEIKPKKLKQDALRLVLLNEMRQAGKDIQKDFEKTTETWEHKPKFEIVISLRRSGTTPEVLVGTDDLIYKFVSKGTKVRYATMTPNFQAKTKPRVIGSNQGSGGVLFISKKRPRPGIEAREFEETIQKKWQPIFKRRMEKAMKMVAERSGHKL